MWFLKSSCSDDSSSDSSVEAPSNAPLRRVAMKPVAGSMSLPSLDVGAVNRVTSESGKNIF